RVDYGTICVTNEMIERREYLDENGRNPFAMRCGGVRSTIRANAAYDRSVAALGWQQVERQRRWARRK
ncbi:MAG TPA: hypothetical protein VHZ29_04410, partial [Rhizomicrobium sp.]|nr:hypothetical protein [Rhizomicrobium sp.]